MSCYDGLPMEASKTSTGKPLQSNLTMPRLTLKGGIQKVSKIRVIRTLPSKRPRRIKKTFIGLPGEIRNEIYKHAMGDLPKGLMLYDGQIMLPFHNLQFVSKQVSAEVTGFVRSYARNAPMTDCIQNFNFEPLMTWLDVKSGKEMEILQIRSWRCPFVMELVCTTDSSGSLWKPLLNCLRPRVYEDAIRNLNIEYTRFDCVEGWVSDREVTCCWENACSRPYGHGNGLQDMVLLVEALGMSHDYHQGMVSEMQRVIDGYLGPTSNPLFHGQALRRFAWLVLLLTGVQRMLTQTCS